MSGESGQNGGRVTIRSPGDENRRPIRRFVNTVLILAGIVLTAGYFAARTTFARSVFEDRLSQAVGGKVTMESARIGFPYDLVFEEVSSGALGARDKSWFRAQEIRMGLGGAGLRVTVRRAFLNVPQGESPDRLTELAGRLGSLNLWDTGELSRLTARIRRRVALDISDSAICWRDERGEETGQATGLAFVLEPVRIPGRTLYFHRLSVFRMEKDGVKVGDWEREWLSSDTGEDVILSRGPGPEHTGAEVGTEERGPGAPAEPVRVRKSHWGWKEREQEETGRQE